MHSAVQLIKEIAFFIHRHRRRLGNFGAARRLAEANRKMMKAVNATLSVSRCELLLGELELDENMLEFAAERFDLCLQVFRAAHQNLDLPDALLAMARLRGVSAQLERGSVIGCITRAIRSFSPPKTPSCSSKSESAIHLCDEAFRLAATSGFALKQCDALNLRALLRREAGEPGKAAEDARQALEIAERCGYYWGRHEALRQLRDAAKASGNRANEKHWDEAEKELSKRMQPLTKEALEIEHAHDRAMERRYGKKKRED